MFVVVFWFCRSSSLAFLKSSYLINLIHHFLLHWVICFGGYLFVHTPVFFSNTPVFLSVTHLVHNYAKIVDEWGRNRMCDRTLPSRLVNLKLKLIDSFSTVVSSLSHVKLLKLLEEGFGDPSSQQVRFCGITTNLSEIQKQSVEHTVMIIW